MKLPQNKSLRPLARELRKDSTLSEVLLWNQLKNKQFFNLDFDRQKIIGNYIVDFYCPSLKLVIEIDGGSHDNKLSYDLTKIYSETFKNEKLYNNLFDSTSSLIKNILAQMGKGIGNGQEIRDEILKVMSRNKIVKHPLNNFYEQWHQKLHNNTTPEDIIICEGVISFLKNKGDINSYWKVLNENGITKERLASYDRKIINEPFYNPNFNIKDFENYLLIIKRVHSTTDLILSFEQ